METIMYILAGILTGGLIAYLFFNNKLRKLAQEIALLTQKTLQLNEKQEESQQRVDRLNSEKNTLQQHNILLQVESEKKSTEIQMLKQQAESEASQRDKQFKEQLNAAQERIANVARQVLEQNAQRLKEANTENIGNITLPLKEAISEMRKALNDTAKGSAETSASLREQIQLMIQSNERIGEKADALTNVLKKDNRGTGYMGEIILAELLASQGLVEGTHFDLQRNIRNQSGTSVENEETGSMMRPDVILHYPNGQDAVIDSKVSIVAYEKYVNTTDEAEKSKFLKEHIASIRRHVGELARKDYSRYINKTHDKIDFVIMFMPFESSLQVALANDTTLWREAFEKKVFITSEQNLIAILHMIHVAWVQNQQAKNQEKVFGLAEQLLDRLGDFAKRYNELGDRLEKVNKAYEETNNKLVSGKQSVVKKARELIDLGAKENPNRRIPEPTDGWEEK